MRPTRIIFFAGKGGVGKTTTATATALRTVATDRHVLLVSTDPAHSVRDCIGLLPSVPPNLTVLEIDPHHELEQNWGQIRDYLTSLIVALGADQPVTAELAMIPGLDNLFSLLRLHDAICNKYYDVVIVDMAPTGESLRLLGLHQAISLALKITTYLEKYLVSPVIRPASKVSKSLRVVVAPEAVAKAWQDLLRKLLDMQRMLTQDAVTSVRLVTQPEKMIVAETKRTLTYLSLFGFTVDCVIVNRIIPPSAGAFLDAWSQTQITYREDIHETFNPIPVREVLMLDHEISTADDLIDIGRQIYADDDPADLLFHQPLVKLMQSPGHADFSIFIPHLDSEAMELNKQGGEIWIRVRHYMRRYAIPDSLAGMYPVRAQYEDGWLHITFEKAVS